MQQNQFDLQIRYKQVQSIHKETAQEKFINFYSLNIIMKSNGLLLHKEVLQLKRRVLRMENILKEDYNLSNWARKELVKARDTPREKYIRHDDILKEFSMK